MGLSTTFELKEFNAASLTGSYQNFGTALSSPAYFMELTNTSDVDAYVSIDGSSNSMRIAAGESLSFPSAIRFNSLTEGVILFKSGTQLEIKQVTASGTGTIIANILTAG